MIKKINSMINFGLKKNATTTYWDEKMKGIWDGLSIPPFIGDGPEVNLRKRVECKWQPPGEGWLKLNIDGAS